MKPVRTLQFMLRQLSIRYPQIPPVTVDGVFGEETLEAVMIFQRDFSLPVTGVVDRATWDAIARQTSLLAGGPSSPLPGYLDAPSLSDFQDPRTLRAVTRFIFNALSGLLQNFTRSDGPSSTPEENIRALQRLSGLPVTGVLDDKSWGVLLRLFQLFILRAGQTA